MGAVDTDLTAFAEVAWEARPNGGRTFRPGKRHLYDASVDLDSVGALATLCGTEVPRGVLLALRGRPVENMSAAALLMTGSDLASAAECRRCAKASTSA